MNSEKRKVVSSNELANWQGEHRSGMVTHRTDVGSNIQQLNFNFTLENFAR